MIYSVLHVINVFYCKYANWLMYKFAPSVWDRSDAFDNFVGCYKRGEFKLSVGLMELFRGEL